MPARTPARAHASRRWASRGSKRPTTIVLTVPRAAVVDLRVTQLAPVCRAAGRIVVRAHDGRNAIQFRGRVQGRTLPAGTYRVVPRIRGGRTLRAMVLVVVAGAAPAPGEVAAARRANVCGGGGGGTAARAATGANGGGASSGLDGAAALRSRHAKNALAASATAVAPAKPKARGGILGAEFTQPLRDPTQGANPLILALLALAIGLLALAALPRTVVASPLLAEQLTNRRLELALAGTATLLVVVLAYLLLV